MKALLLAAGYGTRLYPLTKDTPKPLLEVGGQPMADHICDKLEDVSSIDEVLLVSNDKFAGDFRDWAERQNRPWPITVLNDGTTEDGDRLGAIGDVNYTVQEANVEDDLIVLAGDNLFDFDLNDMVDTFRQQQANVVGTLRFHDESKLPKYGIVDIDDTGEVVGFEEKPDDPPSNLVAMGMYLFPADRLELIQQYLDEGGNPDEPGWYVTWLVENDRVVAHQFDGTWFDIGDKDSLDQADEYLNEHDLT